ncbi:MAG: helix-turn-helix domain protein [Firmicutes bacterium]|nr:helix-turn-helix domain protein [Bacillota bacterium]
MSNMPNNLRRIRLSQKNKELQSASKIAELMDVSPQYYYKLETGGENKKLNVEHLKKLSKIFNCTADEILGNQQIAEESSENKKIPKDLKKILEEKTLMFDGELMNEDDKNLIEQMLTKMYYKSKEQNKRK